MLTKDEILRKMNGFECPKYLHEPCWKPIYDQCVAAIELAEENAQMREHITAIEFERACLMAEIDKLKGR